MFGGCIAYGVGHLNQKAGLEGWRWLVIIEGVLTTICTVLLVYFLPDDPQNLKWLSDDEKTFAVARLQIQDGGYTKERASRRKMIDTCICPRMLAHFLTFVSYRRASSFIAD